ncbi:MAG: N-acetylmuramoyl-L-alanine amidase, partial [Limisphaerales bacterium]
MKPKLFGLLAFGTLVFTTSMPAGQGPQPGICSRACWGARAPKSAHTQMSSLTRAIIHHTAGSSDYTTDYEAGKVRVRNVQNIHMDANGWSDIGYHFLVNAAGHIYEGRSGSMSSLPRGAHDGHNVNSFGFTLLGYFHSPYNQQAPVAMRSALYDVIAWRMPSSWSPYGSGSYNSTTVGYLDGHRKVKATACPGDTFHPVYITENYNGGEARNGVNTRKNPPPSGGRIDVFVRTADATPQVSQRFFESTWSGWHGMGGTPKGSPTVCSWAPGRLDIFARGMDDTLIHKWYDNGVWSAWESLGGTLTDDPAAVSWGNGRIDVFVRSAHQTPEVMQRFFIAGTGWSSWVSMGGTPKGKPAVCSWSPGRLDVFIRGQDDSLQHKFYNGSTWSGWASLGGVLSSDPGATSWGNGRIDVFVRGADGTQQMFHKFFSSGWSGWYPMGGGLAGAPTACSWGPGRLDIFVRGLDNQLHH